MSKKENAKLLALALLPAAFYLFTRRTVKPTGNKPDDDAAPEEDTEEQEEGTGKPTKKPAPEMSSFDNLFDLGSDALETYGDIANSAAQDQRLLDDPLFSGPIFEATAAERQAAREELQVPSGRSLASFLTDKAYFGVGGEKIPKKKNRGAGWDAWIALWSDLHDSIKGYLIPGLNK